MEENTIPEDFKKDLDYLIERGILIRKPGKKPGESFCNLSSEFKKYIVGYIYGNVEEDGEEVLINALETGVIKYAGKEIKAGSKVTSDSLVILDEKAKEDGYVLSEEDFDKYFKIVNFIFVSGLKKYQEWYRKKGIEYTGF